MHIPDGFIDGGTSLAGGAVIATGGVAVCLRRTAQVLDERQVPLVGLTAAFVFAAQMLNFPVASGTSGHLLGGVLAAVLVGPWAGALAVTVVLIVQAFLFADGGLSALGLNVINMALVGALAGYAVFAAAPRLLLPRTRRSLVARRRDRGSAGAGDGLGRVHARVCDRRQRGDVGRHGRHGDDRCARADRHRRGSDHRDDSFAPCWRPT